MKEALFLTRLHPTYQSNLKQECPHAMASAYMLVSLIYSQVGNADQVIFHYNEALRIVNETSAVHREVTYLVWPFQILEYQTVNSFKLRNSENASVKLVLIAFGDIPFDVTDTFSGIEMIIGRFANNKHNSCTSLIQYLSNPVNASLPHIFVDESDEVMRGRIRGYADFLRYSGPDNLPRFYPFGSGRSLPYLTGDGRIIPSSYNSSTFGLRRIDSISHEWISEFQEMCSDADLPFGSIIETMFRNVSITTLRSLSFPRRCDDEDIPISLRHCGMNELLRVDWRDTTLAPVLPRKPVPPF
jgi:hypothetical protein